MKIPSQGKLLKKLEDDDEKRKHEEEKKLQSAVKERGKNWVFSFDFKFSLFLVL